MANLSVTAFGERWASSLCEMKIILTFIWTQINTSLHIHHFTWGLVQLFMAIYLRNVRFCIFTDAVWKEMIGTEASCYLKLSSACTTTLYRRPIKRTLFWKLCIVLMWNSEVKTRIFTLGFHLELMRELMNSKSVLVSQEQFSAGRMSDLLVFFSDKRKRRFRFNMWESHMLPVWNYRWKTTQYFMTAKHFNSS